MSVLFPFLSYDHDETPISFATRLAAQHCKSSVVPFLCDIGIKPDALLGCEDEAVDLLAALASVDAADLYRNSSRRVAKRRFDLRGNALHAEFFASPETVFCPACLRDDDRSGIDPARGRRGRLIWTLRPVRTCPVHGLVLVRRKWEHWDDKFRQMDLIVPERGIDLDRLVDDAESRPASNLQSYLLARLEGAQGPAWLDSQTLEQGVRSTETLGLRLAFGPSKKPSEMTSDEWDVAGNAGYEVTSGGEPAIREALDQMQAEFHGKEGNPGCRKIFAPFYDALSSKKVPKDPGDLRRILRDHIIETMEVSAGQIVLGVALPERRLHSVQSLASEAKLDPRTLRNVLAARGLIPVEQHISSHHVFDAKAGREVAESVLRLTHVTALDKALNCTRPLADQLLDERLLLPISDGASTAAGRTWKGVDGREIERFLLALGADVRSVDIVPTGMVPIAKAAEKARLLSAEIVHLILGGFLENVARRRDVTGYSAILVDPGEVRAASCAVLVGMSATAAFGRMKIPKATGWALTERRSGPQLNPVVIEGRNGQHRIYRFSEKTVTDFMSEFTTAARIATQYDVQKRVAITHLKKAHVRPALDYAETGIAFYRAEDIPDFELA